MNGTITKAYGGFYFVRVEERVLKSKIRGKIKRFQGNALVGDMVNVSEAGADQFVIEEILPRRNELTRPPVANIDQTVIIFSIANPEPNPALLDRFLIQAGAAGIKPVICLNKVDLLGINKNELLEEYRLTGFCLLAVSAKTGVGLENLQEVLKGNITVFAGPSGVGKSSLLNALQPGLQLTTGGISRKLKRGKHTTRHVELIALDGGGLVADTPGFTSMNLPSLGRDELAKFYPEFKSYSDGCRFTSCLHNREPGCAVKDAAATGRISSLRYRQYQTLLQEVMASERSY